MNNNDRINEAIAILQTMNMEDCAQEIDNLRHELERVKGIAGRRLDRIAQLQHDVAVLEDKLEDTRSELKSTFGGAPSRAIEELGREPRSHIDYE